MDSNLGYEIVDSVTRGKVVIATRDFMPGDTVMQEREPVLCLTKEVLAEFKKYDSTDNHLHLAAFIVVMRRIEPAKKAKFLSLYGPTTGGEADILRKYASVIEWTPDDQSERRPLTCDEVETFVKIGNVLRLNAFGDEQAKLIYFEVTRLAHSCAANCTYDIHENVISCRSLRNIAAGEELTISYMRERDIKPTHIRRQKYLEMKDFTCHCPRCDAPGDDTRQFDCSNPSCNGVMMVCQPINQIKVGDPEKKYTGVEYVEPHLLPCTECHRSASAAYQTTMLALEARLPKLVSDIQTDMAIGLTQPGTDCFDKLVQKIQDLKLPMRHQMVAPIHDILVKCTRFQFMEVAVGRKLGDIEQRRAAVHRAVTAYVAAQEGVTPGSNSNLAKTLFQVSHDCIMEWQDPRMGCPHIFTPQQAKPLLQRLLRMKLIMSPRDFPRSEKIDNALLKVLSELPPLQSIELCAFCEESPFRAAVTLSRCGKCKQVCYCSAGCQKVHWKLHKKFCKVEKK